MTHIMSTPVGRWLQTFMCQKYSDVFESWGYKTLQSVCRLELEQLRSMGVLPEDCDKILDNVTILRQSMTAQNSGEGGSFPDPLTSPASSALVNMLRNRGYPGSAMPAQTTPEQYSPAMQNYLPSSPPYDYVRFPRPDGRGYPPTAGGPVTPLPPPPPWSDPRGGPPQFNPQMRGYMGPHPSQEMWEKMAAVGGIPPGRGYVGGGVPRMMSPPGMMGTAQYRGYPVPVQDPQQVANDIVSMTSQRSQRYCVPRPATLQHPGMRRYRLGTPQPQAGAFQTLSPRPTTPGQQASILPDGSAGPAGGGYQPSQYCSGDSGCASPMSPHVNMTSPNSAYSSSSAYNSAMHGAPSMVEAGVPPPYPGSTVTSPSLSGEMVSPGLHMQQCLSPMSSHSRTVPAGQPPPQQQQEFTPHIPSIVDDNNHLSPEPAALPRSTSSAPMEHAIQHSPHHQGFPLCSQSPSTSTPHSVANMYSGNMNSMRQHVQSIPGSEASVDMKNGSGGGGAIDPLQSLHKLAMFTNSQVIDPKSVVHDACFSGSVDSTIVKQGPKNFPSGSSDKSMGELPQTVSNNNHVQASPVEGIPSYNYQRTQQYDMHSSKRLVPGMTVQAAGNSVGIISTEGHRSMQLEQHIPSDFELGLELVADEMKMNEEFSPDLLKSEINFENISPIGDILDDDKIINECTGSKFTFNLDEEIEIKEEKDPRSIENANPLISELLNDDSEDAIDTIENKTILTLPKNGKVGSPQKRELQLKKKEKSKKKKVEENMNKEASVTNHKAVEKQNFTKGSYNRSEQNNRNLTYDNSGNFQMHNSMLSSPPEQTPIFSDRNIHAYSAGSVGMETKITSPPLFLPEKVIQPSTDYCSNMAEKQAAADLNVNPESALPALNISPGVKIDPDVPPDTKQMKLALEMRRRRRVRNFVTPKLNPVIKTEPKSGQDMGSCTAGNSSSDEKFSSPLSSSCSELTPVSSDVKEEDKTWLNMDQDSSASGGGGGGIHLYQSSAESIIPPPSLSNCLKCEDSSNLQYTGTDSNTSGNSKQEIISSNINSYDKSVCSFKPDDDNKMRSHRSNDRIQEHSASSFHQTVLKSTDFEIGKDKVGNTLNLTDSCKSVCDNNKNNQNSDCSSGSASVNKDSGSGVIADVCTAGDKACGNDNVSSTAATQYCIPTADFVCNDNNNTRIEKNTNIHNNNSVCELKDGVKDSNGELMAAENVENVDKTTEIININFCDSDTVKHESKDLDFHSISCAEDLSTVRRDINDQTRNDSISVSRTHGSSSGFDCLAINTEISNHVENSQDVHAIHDEESNQCYHAQAPETTVLRSRALTGSSESVTVMAVPDLNGNTVTDAYTTLKCKSKYMSFDGLPTCCKDVGLNKAVSGKQDKTLVFTDESPLNNNNNSMGVIDRNLLRGELLERKIASIKKLAAKIELCGYYDCIDDGAIDFSGGEESSMYRESDDMFEKKAIVKYQEEELENGDQTFASPMKRSSGISDNILKLKDHKFVRCDYLKKFYSDGNSDSETDESAVIIPSPTRSSFHKRHPMMIFSKIRKSCLKKALENLSNSERNLVNDKLSLLSEELTCNGNMSTITDKNSIQSGDDNIRYNLKQLYTDLGSRVSYENIVALPVVEATDASVNLNNKSDKNSATSNLGTDEGASSEKDSNVESSHDIVKKGENSQNDLVTSVKNGNVCSNSAGNGNGYGSCSEEEPSTSSQKKKGQPKSNNVDLSMEKDTFINENNSGNKTIETIELLDEENMQITIEMNDSNVSDNSQEASDLQSLESKPNLKDISQVACTTRRFEIPLEIVSIVKSANLISCGEEINTKIEFDEEDVKREADIDNEDCNIKHTGKASTSKSPKKRAPRKRKRKSDLWDDELEEEETFKKLNLSKTFDLFKTGKIKKPKLEDNKGKKKRGKYVKDKKVIGKKGEKRSVGPVVKVKGSREEPVSCSVLNLAEADVDGKMRSFRESDRPSAPQVFYELDDAVPFCCAICGKSSSVDGLGDLFGPYFPKDVKPNRSSAKLVNKTPTTQKTQSKSSSPESPPKNLPQRNKKKSLDSSEWVCASTKKGSKSQSSKKGENKARKSTGKGKTPIKSKTGVKSKSCDDSIFIDLTGADDSNQSMDISHMKTEQMKSSSAKNKKSGKDSNRKSVGQNIASTSTPKDKITGSKVTGSNKKGKAGSISSSAIEEDVREIWVHEDCLVWTTGVYVVGQQISGIEEAVNVARNSPCSVCKNQGATLGCFNKGCGQKYHYLCSVQVNCYLDEENFSVFCPKHKRKKLQNAVQNS